MRPRQQPMPPRIPPHVRPQQKTPGGISSLLTTFRTPEGNLDIEKIQVTAQQAKSIYSQVSPLVTKFIKNKRAPYKNLFS